MVVRFEQDERDRLEADDWSTALQALLEQQPEAAGAAALPVTTSLDGWWAAPGVEPSGPAPASGPTSATTDPGETVAQLAALLDAEAQVDPASLPGAVALARTRALLQAREQLTAITMRALADVDTRTLHALDDSPSTPAWVDGLHVQGVDRTDVALARRLRKVPRIADELLHRRLSGSTAALLTRLVLKARPFLDRPDGLIDGLDGEQVLDGVLVDGICDLVAEQVGGANDAGQRLAELREELVALNDPARTQQARWEAALLVFARECDPALLRSGLALLLDGLLPHEHDRRAQQAADDAGLDVYADAFGSGGRLAADLDDEGRELLATVLDAVMATDPAGPEDTARHADGTAALGDDLPVEDWPAEQPRPRSRRRQRHDAFKQALRTLLDSGVLGTRGKVAPHVAVTTTLDFVEAVPGSLPGTTDHGVRLSRTQLRQLLCRSTFTRLVLDARRRVVQASHTQRTSTALERLILKVQGGCTCSRAGCGRGPATGHRLVPHHSSLFSKTGLTELDDTVLICEPDHDTELHAKGRTLRLKDGRVLGPDGWVRR